MTNAQIDENNRQTLIGLSNSDGETIVPVNATNNKLRVYDGGTGPADLISKTLTPLSIKGGVIRNIDNATGDVARTTSGWIEDEKYGIRVTLFATACSAEFDSAVTRTGRLTLKLSTTDVTGKIRASNSIQAGSSNIITDDLKRLFIVKPNTSYKFSIFSKTNNVAADSVFAYMSEYNGITWIKDNSSNKISGTQDWTLLTKSFTTGATTTHIKIVLFNNVAGNISDAWFDVNSMTLEEVTSVTNILPASASFYPKLTAVTSNDNIDQSQVASNAGTTILGNNGNNKNEAQSIVITKSAFNSYVFRPGANTGSPTFDVVMSLQADVAGSPSGTNLGTPTTITAAQWDASNNADYTIPLSLTLTPGTYWMIATPSVQGDSSNNRTIRISNNSNPYSSGGIKHYNGSVWSALDAQYDWYFKTLYSKNTTNLTVSTATQTVSVTSPTVDGWANGTVVNFTDALQLAPGANTVYVSSNGYSASADGTVDPSLQGTFGGIILDKNKGGGINAKIDENSRSTMTVLSSAGDGTIINLYVDPATKRLLIQS